MKDACKIGPLLERTVGWDQSQGALQVSFDY